MFFRFLFSCALSLVSFTIFAQKPAKSFKELSKVFVNGLQNKNMASMQRLWAPPSVYRELAPHFKGYSDAEIVEIIKNDPNGLENKINAIFASIEQFGLSEKEIQWKNVKEQALNAVAPNYYALTLIIAYKNTTDTLLLEAFKNKKNWYFVDIASFQNQKPFTKIIQKHAKYSSQQYYEMALSQIKEEQYKEAFKNLENTQFLSPQNPDVYFQKGNIYKLQKDTLKAIDMYRKAYQIDTEYAPAYFEAGVLALATPEVAYEATYNFEVCLEKEYEVFSSAKYLLDIYIKQLSDWEQEENVDNFYLKNFYEKIVGVANRVLEKEEELSKEEKVKVYLARANNLMELEKINDARNDFEKVIAIDTKHVQALTELAWIENETKNYAKALVYAKQAYELDKNNGDALAELAFAKMQSKDFKGAISDYNALFALSKEFQTAKKFQNRGDCHKALKNNKLACTDYKKATELGADDSLMQEWLKKNCK